MAYLDANNDRYSDDEDLFDDDNAADIQSHFSDTNSISHHSVSGVPTSHHHRTSIPRASPPRRVYSDSGTVEEVSRQHQAAARAGANGNGRKPHSARTQHTSTTTSANNAATALSFRRRKGDQSRSRHRRRRYDVMSKVLVQSAELLQLDKGNARAFTPILAQLLVPPSKQNSKHGSNNGDAKKPPLWRSPTNSTSGSDSGRGTPPPAPTATATSASQTDAPAAPEVDPKAAQEVYSAAVHSFSQGGSYDFVQTQIERLQHLRPFLESLSPGSGIRCMIMLLMQHLLHSQEGYDARIRHAFKSLGVLIFVNEMEQDPLDVFMAGGESSSEVYQRDLVALATRKFESLEHYIAVNLLQIQRAQEKLHTMRNGGRKKKSSAGKLLTRQTVGPTREQIFRGLKIGGTAVVAGTLFAVTGGLAAPGIVAGIATVAGGTAVATTAAAVLSSTAAVTAIFGVGGGGLVGYKMGRRTQGLTEFEFMKETAQKDTDELDDDIELTEAELFSTVCISGWLRDECDFQRPWGITPSKPALKDKMELLERFYSIHSPDHVPKCKKILDSWKGDEIKLWQLLEQKYGRDPSNLFPLDNGPRFQASMTLEQVELVHDMFVVLGYLPRKKDLASSSPTPFERMRKSWKMNFTKQQEAVMNAQNARLDPVSLNQHGYGSRADSLHGPSQDSQTFQLATPPCSEPDTDSNATTENGKEYVPPKHLATVWDYRANYGGELYTVRWEPYLLRDLCDSVAALAKDIAGSASVTVLKHTALSTLMTAVAWPYALVSMANMIDGTWTLAVERADAAGKELARSLLFSGAGNRPVTLVGYSFGARVIYSCLKELARYQEKWEDYRETGKIPPGSDPRNAGMTGEKFYKYMREPASIVEDAIMCGNPNHLSLLSWRACRQVVAGRLVNCFSQKDLILSLMFQFKRLGLKPVCGTCPVNVKGVENIDVTDIVSGHLDYSYCMGDILKKVRLGQPFQSKATMLFVPSVETTAVKDGIEKA